MNSSVKLGKVLGGVLLAVLFVCCFLFIKSTLIIDWGGGVTTNFRLFLVVLTLLIIVLYHIFYPSSGETTKLSLTAAVTVVWLALILFYPFKDIAASDHDASGPVAFFTLIGGLAVCILWIHFFADEIF